MLKQISKEELKTRIELHKLWLEDNSKGERLVLIGYDLRDSNLSYSDLRYSDLRGSDLSNSDLRYSDLRGSNLSNVKLWDTVGNSKEIITLQTPYYCITYTDEVIQIGCKQYTASEWFNFNNEEISKMSGDALEFWNIYKPIIKNLLEVQPAKKTK